MKVRDVMSMTVVTVTPETTLKETAAKLARFGISGLPVVTSSGELVGVVSEADVLAKEAGPGPRDGLLSWLFEIGEVERAKLEARIAGEAMTSPAVTIGPDRSIREAAMRMLSEGVNRLPVVVEGDLVGIVSRADLVRAFVRTDDEIRREIEDEVVRKTLWLEPDRVTVAVDGGAVTLAGEVETAADAEVLVEFTRRVPGVVSVRSLLYSREAAPAV